MKCKFCKVKLTDKNRGFDFETMKKFKNLCVCHNCREKFRDKKLDKISKSVSGIFNRFINQDIN